MFDAAEVPHPDAFDIHRPATFYRNFGAGNHRCAGEGFGRELWVAMAMPLLRRANLRRVPGPNAFPRKGRRLDIPDGLYVQHLEVTAD
jgi:cytochrome P450